MRMCVQLLSNNDVNFTDLEMTAVSNLDCQQHGLRVRMVWTGAREHGPQTRTSKIVRVVCTELYRSRREL